MASGCRVNAWRSAASSVFFPEFWNERRSPDAQTQALRRACKVLTHEIGHTLGLTHCVFYECVMNGSNTLEETDEHPLIDCPVCHRKLLFNIGFDPSKRFAALRDFYAKNQPFHFRTRCLKTTS